MRTLRTTSSASATASPREIPLGRPALTQNEYSTAADQAVHFPQQPLQPNATVPPGAKICGLGYLGALATPSPLPGNSASGRPLQVRAVEPVEPPRRLELLEDFPGLRQHRPGLLRLTLALQPLAVLGQRHRQMEAHADGPETPHRLLEPSQRRGPVPSESGEPGAESCDLRLEGRGPFALRDRLHIPQELASAFHVSHLERRRGRDRIRGLDRSDHPRLPPSADRTLGR